MLSCLLQNIEVLADHPVLQRVATVRTTTYYEFQAATMKGEAKPSDRWFPSALADTNDRRVMWIVLCVVMQELGTQASAISELKKSTDATKATSQNLAALQEQVRDFPCIQYVDLISRYF
jgi:hypothetical protein